MSWKVARVVRVYRLRLSGRRMKMSGRRNVNKWVHIAKIKFSVLSALIVLNNNDENGKLLGTVDARYSVMAR